MKSFYIFIIDHGNNGTLYIYCTSKVFKDGTIENVRLFVKSKREVEKKINRRRRT